MAGQSAGCQTEASVFQNREISGGEAVRCAAQYLAAHQIEDADNDAWLLFSYVTHITRAMFLAERLARMDQEALERYEALLVRRAGRGFLRGACRPFRGGAARQARRLRSE